MSETRFKGSVHWLMDVSAIDALAHRVVGEMLDGQTDGYHCRHPLLADTIADLVASKGLSYHRTHDASLGRHYIWMER